MLQRHKNNFSFWLGMLLITEVLLFSFFYNIHAASATRLAADSDLIFVPGVPIAGVTEIVINGSTIGNYINTFYLWAIRAVTLLAVFMVMLAGIRWITAAGNASTITMAKTQMTDAIIGLVLILCANLILHSINPQLTIFKSLNITKVNPINLMSIKNYDLSYLVQPDDWYDPDLQPSPGANVCGQPSTVYTSLDDKTIFYGANCENWIFDFPGPRRPCALNFSISVEQQAAWDKETNQDSSKLANYIDWTDQGKDNKGKPITMPTKCIGTTIKIGGSMPYGSVIIPSPDNKELIRYPIWPADDCGALTTGVNVHLPGINTWVGSKCVSPGENCVYVTLAAKTGGGSDAYYFTSFCSPDFPADEYVTNCGPNAMRVSCSKCSPNPRAKVPPDGPCNNDWAEVVDGETICCRKSNNSYEIRPVL